MEIATIGFTQSSAQHFFERLNRAGVRRLVDVRLSNVSQLAGFAKANDLAYFLDAISSISYKHDLRLAPTKEMFKAYRADELSWDGYESEFRALMVERKIPDALEKEPFETKTVLLCSEAAPEHCHRRVVAELVAQRWGAVVEHL